MEDTLTEAEEERLSIMIWDAGMTKEQALKEILEAREWEITIEL